MSGNWGPLPTMPKRCCPACLHACMHASQHYAAPSLLLWHGSGHAFEESRPQQRWQGPTH